jgi:hypothetical protein
MYEEPEERPSAAFPQPLKLVLTEKYCTVARLGPPLPSHGAILEYNPAYSVANASPGLTERHCKSLTTTSSYKISSSDPLNDV